MESAKLHDGTRFALSILEKGRIAIVRSMATLCLGALAVASSLSLATVSAQDGNSGREASNQRFDDKLAEWKQVIKELRKIRADYEECTREDSVRLAREWDEYIKRGNQIVDEMKSTGFEQFRNDPAGNSHLIPFLSRMIVNDVAADRYDSAYSIGSTLLESDSLIGIMFNYLGTAAFATNRFDEALDYLTRAVEVGRIDEKAFAILGVIPEYQLMWAEELEYRQRDADRGDLPIIRLETSQGEMIFELFEDDAPGAVGNFVYLVEQGFYDGLGFHRVVAGFVAQTGCPNGDSTGNPGYLIHSEFDNPTARNHFRGSLSMANVGRKDTAGSQFFITMIPTPDLNGKHTVFGRVTKGIEVLEKLARIEPGTAESAAIQPDTIIKAEVISKRDHEYSPRKVGSSDE